MSRVNERERQQVGARAAVSELRKMLPQLRAYAKGLSGNPKLEVRIGQMTATSRNVIFIAPDARLGEKRAHDFSLHGQQDEKQRPLCEACFIQQSVLARCYHEIGHHVAESFKSMTPKQRAQLTRRVIKEYESTGRKLDPLRKQALADKITAYMDTLKRVKGIDIGYMEAARVVSPYLPPILNCLDDVRVNRLISQGNPGVERWMMADLIDIMENGIQQDGKEISLWRDRPGDDQAAIGLFLEGYNLDSALYLSDEVVEALRSPEVQEIKARIQEAQTMEDVYHISFAALEAMRRHGYFVATSDPEELPPPPEAEQAGEPADGAGDASGDSAGAGGGSGSSTTSPTGERAGSAGTAASGDADGTPDPATGATDGVTDDDSDDEDDPSDSDESDDDDDEPGDLSELDDGSEDVERAKRIQDIIDKLAGHPTDPDNPEGFVIVLVGSDPDGERGKRNSSDLDYDSEERDTPTEIDRAMVQVDFDEASGEVWCVRIREPGDGQGWNGEFKDPVFVEEPVIARAYTHLKRAFDDNQRSHLNRDLKSGPRINGKVIGRRMLTGDPRLFAKRDVKKRKSFAVVMSGDISGSTSSYPRLHMIKSSLYAASEMLSRLAIPTEVWCHTASRQLRRTEAITYDGMIPYTLDMYPIKMANQAWDNRAKERLEQIGSAHENLDGHTLEFLRKRADAMRADLKIVLYFTDGQIPAANGYEEGEIFGRELAAIRKRRDMICVGVGVMDDGPRQWGMDTIVIEDLHQGIVDITEGLEKRIKTSFEELESV